VQASNNKEAIVGKRCMRGVMAAAMVACSAAALAQGGGQTSLPCVNDWQRPNACVPRKGTLTPRDFSGLWMRVKGGANLGQASTALLTPLGKQRFDANKPSFGPRAVPPVVGNDPLGKCDPLGLTRNIMTEIAARSFEFVHLPNRVVQFFEYGHQYRTIWTDGRSLPKDPDPRWMGYSVGRWDGDSLVVDTIVLDEREWADNWGHPIGENTRIQERYRRPAFDTLELQMTITDPDLYSKPLVLDTKVHRLQVEAATDERLETFCVPSEEEAFNKAIRNPAGGVK
jgi:hypothetical protein